MPKGFGETSQPETALTDLREKIRQLEIMAANLRNKGPRVLDVLRLRDEVQERYEHLSDRGVDMRAERTRIDTVDNIIRRQDGAFMRELATSGGLAAAREERQPPDAYWWWFVDVERGARLRKGALRYGLIFVGVLLALALGNYVLDRFYGMSPVEQEAYERSSMAEQYLQQGDYEAAIAEYEAANEISPSASNYAWLVALYEQTGSVERSEEALANAESLTDNHPALYTSIALCYDMLGVPEQTEAWSYRALAIDDRYAQAWLYLASAAEARGETQAAVNLFEEAAELAAAQGNDSLYVLARMRMGMLMGGGAMGGAGF